MRKEDSLRKEGANLKYNRIVLIGFRGVGKSTIGKKIAASLNWKYMSTDDLIKEATGQNISYLVETKGWQNFRIIESEVIRALKSESQVVIDCGGGIVENSENIKFLSPHSLVVWVDAELSDILERLSEEDDRPLLTSAYLEDDIVNNYKRRFPLYQCYSQYYVNSSKDSVGKLSMKIIAHLKRLNDKKSK